MTRSRNAQSSATAPDAIASNADFVSFSDAGTGSGNRRAMGGVISGVLGGGASRSEGGASGHGSNRPTTTDRAGNGYNRPAVVPESGSKRKRGVGSAEAQGTASRRGAVYDSPRSRERGSYRHDGGRPQAPDGAYSRNSRYPAPSEAPGPSRIQRDLDRLAQDKNSPRHASQPRDNGRISNYQPESRAAKRKIRWDEDGDRYDIDEADYDSRTGRFTEPMRDQPRSSAPGHGGNGNRGGPTYNGGYTDYAKPSAHASLPRRPEAPRESMREPPRKKAKASDHGQARQTIQMRPTSRHDQYQAPWIDKYDFAGQSSLRTMLNGEIRAAAAWLSPTAEEHSFRQKTFDLVRTVINNEFKDARAFLFGSQVSGLYLPGGDLDIVIDENTRMHPEIRVLPRDTVPKHSKHTTHGMNRREVEEFSAKHAYGNAVLRTLKEKLMRAGVAQYIEHVIHARVPVLKFKSSQGDIPVDISFSSLNGIETASLIARFLEEWPALRPVVLIVKAWLSGQNFNEVRFGGLSSYAIICMWIRQFQNDSRIKLDGEDPDEFLFDLLVDFFRFYAGNSATPGGFDYARNVICIREGDEDENFPFCGHERTKEELGWANAHREAAISIMDPCDPDNDISKGSSSIVNIARTMNEVFLSLDDMYKARRREWKEWEHSDYRELPREWTDDRGKLDPKRVSVLHNLTTYTARDIIQRAKLRDWSKRDTLDVQIQARGGYMTTPEYVPGALSSKSGGSRSRARASKPSGTEGRRDRARNSRDATPDDPAESKKRRRNSLEGAIMLDDSDVIATGRSDSFESATSDEEDQVEDGANKKGRKARAHKKPRHSIESGRGSLTEDEGGPSTPLVASSGVQVIHQAETGDPSAAPVGPKEMTKEERIERKQKIKEYWASKSGMAESPAPSLGSSSKAGRPLTPKRNGSGGRSQPINIAESEEDDAPEVVMGEDSQDGDASGWVEERTQEIAPQDQQEAIESQADFVPL